MNERTITTIHEWIEKAVQAQDLEALDALSNEYAKTLGVGENPGIQVIWNDIEQMARTIVTYRNAGAKSANDELYPDLSEQERAELMETERVINRNLFQYHFQPIVNTFNGEVFAYEALMRPQSHLCPSPFKIIKYAEYTGKLDDIERATFLNILDIVGKEKERLGNRRIFINSIPRTKLTPEDHERVRELLNAHSDSVVVEMTEQSELDDAELNVIKTQYQDMQIKLAIDDYGTGYSNVNNLLRYMPEFVKIDRSLITNIQNSPQKRHFVREIIEFCHDNNILALAEGVETSEELHTVILLGADLIQGFYTARPSAEIIESIPHELKQEIYRYHSERADGKKQQIYIADNAERVLLDRLKKENYSNLILGQKGNDDVTVTCTPGVNTNIHIEVANGFCGTIVIENIDLTNVKGRPCIEIGDNCEVTLVLCGENYLHSGGIRVPETSKLTVNGEGRLRIMLDALCNYGIGCEMEARHGDLIFEQIGGIFVDLNCTVGVCIGSGQGGNITIYRGQYVLNMRGSYGVGIGAFHADSNLEISGCDIDADINMSRMVAIGSIEGSSSVHLYSSSAKIKMAGNDVVGIGTLDGERSDIHINDASLIFRIMGDHCSAIAALEGATRFKLSRASLNIAIEGDKVLGLGGFSGDTQFTLTNSSSVIHMLTPVDYKEYINDDDVKISGGRVELFINRQEVPINGNE